MVLLALVATVFSECSQWEQNSVWESYKLPSEVRGIALANKRSCDRRP